MSSAMEVKYLLNEVAISLGSVMVFFVSFSMIQLGWLKLLDLILITSFIPFHIICRLFLLVVKYVS